MKQPEVTIGPVRSRRELREFIKLPFRLYQADPNWVPPLIAERRRFLDPRHNPFYRHAEVALWLARRGRRVVGRITSHIDHLHNSTHRENVGMFGFFESEDDFEVAEALLARARDWCQQRGAEALRGPQSFSLNHECGLLVDGWDGPPVFMMPYNPPVYAELFERFGLAKKMDLLSYTLRRSDVGGDPDRLPSGLIRPAEALRSQAGVTIRRIQMRAWDEEIRQGLEIFRQAWSGNWGFVPPSDRETAAIVHGLNRIVDPRLTFAVEIGGREIGFSLVVVDANQVLAHLDGRLFPLGWLKAQWYARRITGHRLLLFGVLKEHRGKGVDALLMLETLKAGLATGFQTLELSWILENNVSVRHLIETRGAPYGIRVHRRYRIFEMPLRR